MHAEGLGLEGLAVAFDRRLEYWHTDPADYARAGVSIHPTALELAWSNYCLWHEEDKARRTDVDDGAIAQVKRNIDRLNQRRNDLIERLYEAILVWAQAKTPARDDVPINSETPGSVVDRISILSLKVYHMHEDSLREDVDDAHRNALGGEARDPPRAADGPRAGARAAAR